MDLLLLKNEVNTETDSVRIPRLKRSASWVSRPQSYYKRRTFWHVHEERWYVVVVNKKVHETLIRVHFEFVDCVALEIVRPVSQFHFFRLAILPVDLQSDVRVRARGHLVARRHCDLIRNVWKRIVTSIKPRKYLQELLLNTTYLFLLCIFIILLDIYFSASFPKWTITLFC